MRLSVSIWVISIYTFFSFSSAAMSSKIAGVVVESMPSADIVKFVVSPPKSNYEHKIVCGGDSIRVRFFDIGLNKKGIKTLPVPSNSILSRARIVSQMKNKSVLQIHTKGLTLDACTRTSVMMIDGNLVVSMALTDEQKKRRGGHTLVADNAAGEVDKKNASAPRASSASNAAAPDSIVSNINKNASKNISNKGKIEGTIFDKSKSDTPLLVSQSQVESQTMKYAGGLLFAAFIGFVAWYLKKKKFRFKIEEDNIDILSRKKVSSHQQLMVASVNGAKFLLAVGDKSVTSLGLIPMAGQDDLDTTAAPTIHQAVKESLDREPNISAVPYSQIKDEESSIDTAQTIQGGFGADFKSAIEKISRQRDSELGHDTAHKAVSNNLKAAYNQSEVPSNVAGLISMARMKASLENRNSPHIDDYRA